MAATGVSTKKYYRALAEFKGQNPGDLTFKEGEILLLENAVGDWYKCCNKEGKRGNVPSNYLEEYQIPDTEEEILKASFESLDPSDVEAGAAPPHTLPRPGPLSAAAAPVSTPNAGFGFYAYDVNSTKGSAKGPYDFLYNERYSTEFILVSSESLDSGHKPKEISFHCAHHITREEILEIMHDADDTNEDQEQQKAARNALKYLKAVAQDLGITNVEDLDLYCTYKYQKGKKHSCEAGTYNGRDFERFLIAGKFCHTLEHFPAINRHEGIDLIDYKLTNKIVCYHNDEGKKKNYRSEIDTITVSNDGTCNFRSHRIYYDDNNNLQKKYSQSSIDGLTDDFNKSHKIELKDTVSAARKVASGIFFALAVVTCCSVIPSILFLLAARKLNPSLIKSNRFVNMGKGNENNLSRIGMENCYSTYRDRAFFGSSKINKGSVSDKPNEGSTQGARAKVAAASV